MRAGDRVSNRTFEELRIGESASQTRTVTRDDIALFAILSGDVNPIHPGYLGSLTASSMWGGAFASAVLGTKLPGPGTSYVGQSMRLNRAINVGDVISTTLTVREKRPDTKTVVLDWESVDQAGEKVMSGVAEVIAPTEKIQGEVGELPEVKLRRHEKYDALIARCRAFAPVTTAVVYPCDAPSLSAAMDAAELGLIAPLLVGPAGKIRAVAQELKIDLSRCEIVDTPDSHAAAEAAVSCIREGKAQLLMKGSLHTDELLGAVVRSESGLRTARRISHCFIADVPTYPKPLIITDAAINIYPSLEDKVDIVQNAIDLARALGLMQPRVAILSAVETVNPKIKTTLDAAALCKMADRGQIAGAILDGPLALDNAISKAAADIKGIRSPVAGEADILVVPDLEAGNMVCKNLSFLADADMAGVVVGARVPIVLTSRADNVRARLASCAVGSLCVQALRGSAPAATV
jgi:phosphate acetyltransferase